MTESLYGLKAFEDEDAKWFCGKPGQTDVVYLSETKIILGGGGGIY